MNSFIVNHISSWFAKLYSFVSSAHERKKEVYTIAISRKMPKMFDWLKKQSEISFGQILSHGESIADFFDKCNITTEHALPFLFNNRNKDDYEIIVVDDIIITGSTLRHVSCDIYAISGKMPYASAIFKCADIGVFPYCETSMLSDIDTLSVQQKSSAIDFIAKSIIETSLPIDLVYPLLYIDDGYKFTSNILAEKAKTCDLTSYTVHHEDEFCDSLTVILDGLAVQTYNNDFAKLRLFNKDKDGCILGIYAPNVISVDLLLHGNPFSNNMYSYAWTVVKDAAVNPSVFKIEDMDPIDSTLSEERIRHRLMISLAVWANYLYSLSTYNRVVKNCNLIKNVYKDAHIKESDLELLIGHLLSKTVFPIIENILKNGEISPSQQEYIPVESFIVPDSEANRYNELKNKAAYNHEGNDALNALFEVQREPGNFGIRIPRDGNTENAGLGESFASLIDFLTIFSPKIPEIANTVNLYIDYNIDECRISSFYAVAKTPSGKEFIKRFFRAGANSFL